MHFLSFLTVFISISLALIQAFPTTVPNDPCVKLQWTMVSFGKQFGNTRHISRRLTFFFSQRPFSEHSKIRYLRHDILTRIFWKPTHHHLGSKRNQTTPKLSCPCFSFMDFELGDCRSFQRYHLHPVSSLPVHFGCETRNDGIVFVFGARGFVPDVRLGEHVQCFCHGVHQGAWDSESFWDGVFEEESIQHLHDNWVLGDRDDG